MKLGGKINTIPRYMIDINGTDPLSLGFSGGGVFSEKIVKNEVLLTYERVIGSNEILF